MGSANSNKLAVMSFLKELRRRNVIRVAIAYAIAAWLLIEITATTFPMLRLPEWTATFSNKGISRLCQSTATSPSPLILTLSKSCWLIHEFLLNRP